MRNFAYSESRRTRRVSGKVSNNGTAAIVYGTGFTISRSGAGVVVVTLTRPGKLILGASVTPINATAATSHMAKVSDLSASAMTVRTYVADGTDGAPADIDFFFEILAKDVTV